MSARGYHIPYVNTSGVDLEKLPEIVPSASVLGKLTQKAAGLLGLSENTAVVAGGVDNACMALGAACYSGGKSYTSLGTSAWIAVSDSEPIVNLNNKTYVFEHCVDGQYVSAVSIFSAGRSLKWVKDTLCKNIEDTSKVSGETVYISMDTLAEKSPVGAKKLYFNPSLSVGSPLDKSQNTRGSFVGWICPIHKGTLSVPQWRE